MPTLFVGVGPCAQKTLAEFSRMAQRLIAPIPGPFGLVLADSRGEGLFLGDWPCVSDLRLPEPALLREGLAPAGPGEEKLVSSLSSLVRRLHAIELGADGAPGSHLRLSSYVAIDLSDVTAVASALRLLRALREVDPAVDTTVVALTGRAAAHASAADHEWFEAWKLLLEQLQDGPAAQRVYLLDGCDTDKTWFERPEQLHRLGAEFLLYHGITCRHLVKPTERTRTGSHERLLSVCGSFGCRTMTADLSLVAQRVAERLARDDLADLYRRTVPTTWFSTLQDQARSLVDRIALICEKAYQAKAASGARRTGPDAGRSENMEIAETIRKTVKYVCSREPLLSLCLFFQLLQPRLARLLSQQRLWERARTRHIIAQLFLRQQESTYEPMRLWLARSQTRWVDRFTPAQQGPCHVLVSRPASMRCYFAGGLVLMLGLAGVALGVFVPSGPVAAMSGLASIAAAVLMTLPTGWTRHPRHWLREGQELELYVPSVSYRKRARGRTRQVCKAMTCAGVLGVAGPLGPHTWTLAVGVWAVVLVVLIGAGLAFLAREPGGTRPDEVRDPKGDGLPLRTLSEGEAPGHARPPAWRHRAPGLLCLAMVWTVFCLGPRLPAAPDALACQLALLVGLGLIAVAAGVGLFPRVGRTYLVDRVARMPQPLTGGIGRPVKDRDLPSGVTALAAWINRLVLDPDQCLERLGATDVRPGRERLGPALARVWESGTLLDFVATDWEGQLTQAFRRAVEAQAGKPLKTLALQPGLWTACVMHQLQGSREGNGVGALAGGGSLGGAPAGGDASRWGAGPRVEASAGGARSRCELASLFALQAVRAWIQSCTVADLLSYLTLDLARFGSLVGRLAPVHWPIPRAEPDVSTTIIAVGKSLWDALAPLAKIPRAPAVVLLDWDSCDDRIVVLHAVQGLTEGWRGFPGLPGQLHGDAASTQEPGGTALTPT